MQGTIKFCVCVCVCVCMYESTYIYIYIYTFILQNHPFYLASTDALIPVGELLSQDGCGPSDHMQFQLICFHFFIYLFISLFLI